MIDDAFVEAHGGRQIPCSLCGGRFVVPPKAKFLGWEVRRRDQLKAEFGSLDLGFGPPAAIDAHALPPPAPIQAVPAEMHLPCPHCGFVYGLDAEYLAAYGGQEIECERCRGTISLPASAPSTPSATLPEVPSEPPPLPPQHPLDLPPQPPPVPVPYAGPPGTRWAWQAGYGTALVANDAELPGRCILCGRDAADAPRVNVWLRYVPPREGLALVSKLAVLASIRMVHFRAGACRLHGRLIVLSRVAPPVLLVAGLVSAGFGLGRPDAQEVVRAVAVVGGLAVAVVGGLWGMVAGWVLPKVDQVDGPYAWVSRVHPSVIAALPPRPDVLSAAAQLQQVTP
ncbi:MAG TPA: hypothetical protein VF796_22310 [Humisphaera sp.]